MNGDEKLEKIYSQEDMDNITSKVRESTKAKFEKDFVSKDTYTELEQKYNELESKFTKTQVEKDFLALGGIENNFNDYWDLEKDNFIGGSKVFKEAIKNSMETRKWAFGSVETIPIPQDKQIVGEMFQNDISDLASGTIYKKNW